MGETKGVCARSGVTLSCVGEVNACERDAVQANGVMEQGGPWVFDVEACALVLASDGECVCMHS